MSLASKVGGDLRVTGVITSPNVSEIKHPKTKVSLSSAQPIDDVSWETIIFDTEDQDELGGFTASDSKIYVPYTGLYFIEANLSHAHSAGDEADARGVRLLINGNSTYQDGSGLQYAGIIISAGGSSVDTRQGISSFVFLNVGNYVEVQGYQNTGGSNNIVASGAQFAWTNLAVTLFGSTAAETRIG
jgi:hypothetical protein